jgi:hypothetical protein
MTDPRAPMTADENTFPNQLEIRFNRPVNLSSMADGINFLVARETGGLIAGTFKAVSPDTVRWTVSQGRLTQGSYVVIIRGDGDDGIRSDQGVRLDGDASQLPSGNGREGGNFSFKILVN